MQTESSATRQRISLKAVQDATPAESQEESHVLRSMELSTPTGSSGSNFDQATGMLPSDFTGDAEKVENDLLKCAAQINQLHENTGTADGGPPPAAIFRDKKNQAETQTDKFAANAGQLFHRFNKRQQIKRNLEDEETGRGKGRKSRKQSAYTIESMENFKRLITSNRDYTLHYIRTTLFFLIIPATGVACLLFYVFENPVASNAEWLESAGFAGQASGSSSSSSSASEANSTGSALNESSPITYFAPPELSTGTGSSVAQNLAFPDAGPADASYSWWILFLGVRQVITFGLARAFQFLLVSYITRSPGFGVLRPWLRLFFLQARGWPLHLIFWGSLDFMLLYGDRPFSEHWLYWQDYMEVFNETNPSGSVTSDHRYRGLLIFLVCASLAVAVKRFVIGLKFGKNSYQRYAEKLSVLLQQILLVTKVAKSADYTSVDLTVGDDNDEMQKWLNAGETPNEGQPVASGEDVIKTDESLAATEPVDTERTDSGVFTETQRAKIAELLGAWEEIEIADPQVEDPSLSALVQFRASIGILDSDLPFSQSFGVARTRNQVIDCSQQLYLALLNKQNEIHNKGEGDQDTVLRFHTIALTALRKNGTRLDEKRVKDLVTLFRPTRDGNITLVEFCKSIDIVYKEMRMLRASIASEGRMNAASEKFLNAIFYFILVLIGCGVVGIDTVALFGFMASFILGISFMISGASSDYFRGLLFILVQRPYDIGDRIAVASAQTEASGSGSSGWIVKDVTLYHTTVIYGTTQEYATFSNGALSTSRIINAARSPRATLGFLLKFGIHVSSKTIEQFKLDLMEHVKSKPREWLAFSAFRMTRIEADLGFVEYKCVLQHRESWQQVGALLTSLASVQVYAADRIKEMGMDYVSPSLPVEMRLAKMEKEGRKDDALQSMSRALEGMFGSP